MLNPIGASSLLPDLTTYRRPPRFDPTGHMCTTKTPKYSKSDNQESQRAFYLGVCVIRGGGGGTTARWGGIYVRVGLGPVCDRQHRCRLPVNRGPTTGPGLTGTVAPCTPKLTPAHLQTRAAPPPGDRPQPPGGCSAASKPAGRPQRREQSSEGSTVTLRACLLVLVVGMAACGSAPPPELIRLSPGP